MEVDHIYICTEFRAPAGDLLKEFGIEEGSSNIHPGQGTASRRFYFHNMMLELLWVENTEEVQNELTKPMRLFERCLQRTSEISPFGIAVRPTIGQDEGVLFPVWDYHPVYLPNLLKMQVADNTPLKEPMYFYLSFARRPDMVPLEKRQPMNHKIHLREVTSVKLHINQDDGLSDAGRILSQSGIISIVNGLEHFIELEFDGATSKQGKDFRPELPLILRW
jgi:hypothetical protein